MNSFTLTQLTEQHRCGDGGLTLTCSQCEEQVWVQHLNWFSLECRTCETNRCKSEWLRIREVKNIRMVKFSYQSEQSPVEDGPKTYDEIHGV
jgi:hypothetical protein